MSQALGTVITVSLTSRLSRRGDPIREFFEERLPNLKGVQARWRECGLPRIVPQSNGGSPGTVGTAFDYRVRYLFDASTSPNHFVAYQGAVTLAGYLVRGGEPDALDRLAIGTDLYGRLSGELTAFVDRLDPVGRWLSRADEKDLCRHCYVLALYDECFRMGLRWESPLQRLGADASPADALALVPEGAVSDLCALAEGLHSSQLASRVGGEVVANPVFSGSALVGGADADLIVDGCLIELKVTTQRPAREWVYQLLGYVLLDFDNRFGIEQVGFYHARGPALLTWDLQELLNEAAGQPLDLPALQSQFRALAGSDRAVHGSEDP